jgi:chromosome segregation ATPase
MKLRSTTMNTLMLNLILLVEKFLTELTAALKSLEAKFSESSNRQKTLEARQDRLERRIEELEASAKVAKELEPVLTNLKLIGKDYDNAESSFKQWEPRMRQLESLASRLQQTLPALQQLMNSSEKLCAASMEFLRKSQLDSETQKLPPSAPGLNPQPRREDQIKPNPPRRVVS